MKDDRGPYDATTPSMLILFSTLTQRSPGSKSSSLSSNSCSAVSRCITDYHHQEDRYDLQRQVAGEAQQEVGGMQVAGRDGRHLPARHGKKRLGNALEVNGPENVVARQVKKRLGNVIETNGKRTTHSGMIP
ncbi:hypothetical protein DAPPUDRAFT_322042 [Daphnia pulex]|uniref:Uncharacterized protein n=1 Tax=Daphnia pulex TaxID=6669 RepID=E9GUF2_DAPPU|nr:hypothetical protein DAPPUDRAFT_322042 [Daphnia pulex]|eukprot:EFX76858.1 hypothetical protein DAPPUDRAFT_322042 [Daphnia pulex]